ncbi:MAG: hypothetical protein R3C26_16385 [Calditrichia bacterium]
MLKRFLHLIGVLGGLFLLTIPATAETRISMITTGSTNITNPAILQMHWFFMKPQSQKIPSWEPDFPKYC